jgi:hypothetical protein
LVQAQNKKVIQFSGIIVSADSSKPIPFVTITVRGSSKGTISNFFGFYSLAVELKDTVEFSSVGLKRSRVIIPDTIRERSYTIIKELKPDTIILKTAVVYPWTTERFKAVFLQKKVPDDNLERARKNLDQASMKMLFNGLAMDGSMNHKNYMQQHADKIYYAGQTPPNNLLNPFAWAQFLSAWKEGKLKIQTE